MKYNYICGKCGAKKEVDWPMGSSPKEMTCDCGGIMEQDFLGKLKTIQSDLPEDYRSQSEYHSVDYGDDDDLEKMMNVNS